MAQWALATQLALRLALDQPDRVEAVVLIGGVLKMYYEINPATLSWTLDQRRNFADAMGDRWFKTVTRGGIWLVIYCLLFAISAFLVMQTLEAMLYRLLLLALPSLLAWRYAGGFAPVIELPERRRFAVSSRPR